MWTAKTVKRPLQQPAQPQCANYWAPLTRKRHILPHPTQPQHTNHWAPRTRNAKRHQQEHRLQRPTERSDSTQHAEGRTGDCPGRRNETATQRNVTQGRSGGGPLCTFLVQVHCDGPLSDYIAMGDSSCVILGPGCTHRQSATFPSSSPLKRVIRTAGSPRHDARQRSKLAMAVHGGLTFAILDIAGQLMQSLELSLRFASTSEREYCGSRMLDEAVSATVEELQVRRTHCVVGDEGIERVLGTDVVVEPMCIRLASRGSLGCSSEEGIPASGTLSGSFLALQPLSCTVDLDLDSVRVSCSCDTYQCVQNVVGKLQALVRSNAQAASRGPERVRAPSRAMQGKLTVRRAALRIDRDRTHPLFHVTLRDVTAHARETGLHLTLLSGVDFHDMGRCCWQPLLEEAPVSVAVQRSPRTGAGNPVEKLAVVLECKQLNVNVTPSMVDAGVATVKSMQGALAPTSCRCGGVHPWPWGWLRGQGGCPRRPGGGGSGTVVDLRIACGRFLSRLEGVLVRRVLMSRFSHHPRGSF